MRTAAAMRLGARGKGLDLELFLLRFGGEFQERVGELHERIAQDVGNDIAPPDPHDRLSRQQGVEVQEEVVGNDPEPVDHAAHRLDLGPCAVSRVRRPLRVRWERSVSRRYVTEKFVTSTPR